MTSYQTLLTERRVKSLLVTLNRSDAAHGLNGVMARELADVAQASEGDSTIRAVVLTAAGRFFCAGDDVKAMAGFGECVSARLGGVAAGADW